MHTILGAGGAMATTLARELLRQGHQVRLVARNPHPLEGASTFVADLSRPSAVMAAVADSSVAYLVAGLKYDRSVWRELWPKIMANVIEACKRRGVRLVFFDNVYMYGRVSGPMTEETPYNPCSKKGEIRAQIATALLDAMKAGGLHALIARSADFYGPYTPTGIPNLLVFGRLAAGSSALCLGKDSVPHSYTYVPDAAHAMALLAAQDRAWGQTWHLPTAPNPPTGKEFIRLAAAALAVEPRYRKLGRLTVALGGLFDTTTRELFEMLYQNARPYLFDSGKFERAFDVAATPYADGIRVTALTYHPRASK